MKRLKRILFLLLLLFFMSALASVASADTVAYWRFDGDGSAGSALPDIGGQTGWNGNSWVKAVHDWSENGNHLATWDSPTYGGTLQANVPAAIIPLTGASNALSMQVDGNGDLFSWSEVSSPSGINVDDITPGQWTVEASFNVAPGTWRTIVGRAAWQVCTVPYPTPPHQQSLEALYFSVRPGEQVAVEYVDVDGYQHNLESATGLITEGEWYNMVAVSDGEELSIYLDDVASGLGYQLVAGPFNLTDSGSNDTSLAKGLYDGTQSSFATSWLTGTWSVGRAVYGGNKVDFSASSYIDEVRISNTALRPSQFLFQQRAADPYPPDESPYGAGDVTLAWVAAGNAAEHDVYFGEDVNEVDDANSSLPIGPIYRGRVEPNSFYISGLERGKTYYWRIDEVNDTDIWKGDVWSFLAMPTKAWGPDPYNDKICVPTNLTLSWNAGAESSDSKVYFGTSPGSLSYETTIAHTEGVLRYSHPKSGLNNDQDYYWRIDEVPEGGGDDVTGDEWHFKTIPVITPTDPNLVGWWLFDEGQDNAIDWSGLNQHGTVYGGAESVAGYDGYGINFDGDDDYVSLPIGTTISTLNSATIATWVNFTNTGGAWQRIFDFGDDVNVYMFLSPRIELEGVMRFAITTTSGGGESQVDALYTLPTGWHHVAVVIDEDYSEIVLYVDGAPVNSGVTAVFPSDLGATANNWLGRSQWAADAYFSGTLDDFRIYNYAMTQEDLKQVTAPKEASLPEPADYATGVDRYPTLSWEPGQYAADVNGHELYYSTEFNDVNERIGDPFVLDDPCYVIPGPNAPYESLQVIYWVVDEVNDSHLDGLWEGNVWRFTIKDYSVIDDFEVYTGTGKSSPPPADTLKSVWVDGNYAFVFTTQTPGTSGSLVQLNTDTYDGNPTYAHYQPEDIAQSGAQSMKFYYDNDGTVTWEVDLYSGYPEDLYTYTPTPDTYLSEAYAAIDDTAQADPELDSLDLLRDFSGYKVLGLSFYGDPNNDAEPMYVGLEDGDGTLVTIQHPNPDLTKSWWQDWYIKLSEFTDKNAGLALADIAKIYIGFGDKDSPASGGTGVVFFDDIQLFTEGVCLADVPCDLDGDCAVNNGDLRVLTNAVPWYGEKPISLPTPIINLDASAIAQAVGTQVTSWSNSGSMGGAFTDFNTSDSNAPVLSMVEGKKAVTFSEVNDLLIWDNNAPGSITGANDFTVMLEVFNIDIGVEEWVLAWSQRSTPDGSFAAFGYGTHEDWGAAAHYGAPDMGFGPIGAPAAHTWHTIAFTYDGTTESIVVDGLVYDTEAKVLLISEDQPVVIGTAYEAAAGGSILGAWNPVWEITGWTLRYIGSVASIKVYDESVPAVELALWMGSEADLRIDNKIDFKDIAVLAGDCWLTGPFLFGD